MLTRIFGLLIFIPLFPVIIIACFISKYVHKSTQFGIFKQKRVGKNFRVFNIYKIQSMQNNSNNLSATSSNDLRLSKFGRYIRNLKVDELPQLFNLIKGDMVLIGYRPEISEVVKRNKLYFKNISKYKPGITGMATLIFRDEELILDRIPIKNRQAYSDEVLFNYKCKVNAFFYEYRNLLIDLIILIVTILPILRINNFYFLSHRLVLINKYSIDQRAKAEMEIIKYL